jgi:uncharacterized membrane protein
LRHKALAFAKPVPWRYAAVGTVALAGLVVAMRPAPSAMSEASSAPVNFAQVQSVVGQRCTMCHGAAVQNKNVRLDSADEIGRHAQAIYQQAVVLKAMPMNNATGITEAERALLGRWFEAGAPR